MLGAAVVSGIARVILGSGRAIAFQDRRSQIEELEKRGKQGRSLVEGRGDRFSGVDKNLRSL